VASGRDSDRLSKESGQSNDLLAGTRKFQEDPYWRDYLLFYEYFHGDNGAGLGANHQTGWTGIIARIMHLFATLKPEHFAIGKKAYFETYAQSEAAAPPDPGGAN
jgi:hypothetical protein